MNDGDFSIDVLNKVIDDKHTELIADKKCDKIPCAFILGGQSGAGKTGLQKILSAQLNDNLIVINGDEFRSLQNCR